uniref:Putative rte ele1 orf1-h 1e-60-j 4 n=1 Tax=Ixodes ricinus TaxID=34613 RepID=A0A0K8RM71_IXORI
MVQRSVRQGCPMSPLLLNVYLEPLCRDIINNTNIQRFRLHACEVKLLAYADDLVLICTDKPSIATAMSRVADYCSVSGASVNKEKSSGSWCGSWGTTPTMYEDIQWSTNRPKLLGVPLSAMDNPRSMWDSVRTNVKSAAHMWNLRYISIFGKAAVCNIFLLAKLTYLLQVMHCSRVTVNELQQNFCDIYLEFVV